MKFEHKVFEVLYNKLYVISNPKEIKIYGTGKKRLLDLFSLIQIYEKEEYEKFKFFFLNSLNNDYCWTVVGFWNILREKFPETVRKYLDFKDMYEFLFEDKSRQPISL